MRYHQNRKVVSTRMTPGTIEKLDCLVNHYNIDTTFWGQNRHTTKLGYWNKKVTRSDVLEILVDNAFKEIQKSIK
jgi:hypothetical protein